MFISEMSQDHIVDRNERNVDRRELRRGRVEELAGLDVFARAM